MKSEMALQIFSQSALFLIKVYKLIFQLKLFLSLRKSYWNGIESPKKIQDSNCIIWSDFLGLVISDVERNEWMFCKFIKLLDYVFLSSSFKKSSFPIINGFSKNLFSKNLPSEILLNIFDFLDSETLRNVSVVCQR